MVSKNKKTRLKADCGSDHQIIIEKFRFKLKKVEKTTRPFRYDLNQIPYHHTVEMTNRFKGLALVGRVPKDIWTEISSKKLEGTFHARMVMIKTKMVRT